MAVPQSGALSIWEHDGEHEEQLLPQAAGSNEVPLDVLTNGRRYAERFNEIVNAPHVPLTFTYEMEANGQVRVYIHVGTNMDFSVAEAGPFNSKEQAKEAANEIALKNNDFIKSFQAGPGEDWKAMTDLLRACDVYRAHVNFACKEIVRKKCGDRVHLGSELFHQSAPFASKAGPQIGLCKQAIEKLPNLTESTSTGTEINTSAESEASHSEDWVSILHKYTQRKGYDNPQFHTTDGSNGPFSCTVTFQGSPDVPFGTGVRPAANKQQARKNAAMEAVQWLRETGQLQDGNRKQKNTAVQTTQRAPTRASELSITRAFDELSVSDMSLQSRVARLAASLGLSAPTYSVIKLDGGFVTMEANFSDRDVRLVPELQGPVGKVEHVFGTKEAKLQCCRAVQTALEAVRGPQNKTNF